MSQFNRLARNENRAALEPATTARRIDRYRTPLAPNVLPALNYRGDVKKTDRILIVGGGIAGLALAVALRQRGFQFDLIERSATWTTAGAGIILHANTTRALRTIGLEKDVIARGAVLPTVKHLDKRGRTIGEVFLGDVWDGLGPTVGIHRWELHDVLLSAISNPSIRMGTSLVGLRQNEGGVQVSLSDGSNHEYALVVGADGIRSTVRRSVFPVTSPRPVHQYYWRTCIEDTGLVSTWTLMRIPGLFLGLMPLGQGLVYLFVQLATEEQIEDPIPGRVQRLRTRFQDFGGFAQDALRLITDDEAVHFGSAQEIALDQWRSERVLLIGDAAHAVSPILGQGGGMAMEDAIVLAELLDANTTLDRALAQFVCRREPRVRRVRQRTHQIVTGWAGVDMTGEVDQSSSMLAEMRESYQPLKEFP